MTIKTFTAGERLTAQDLNDNFDTLNNTFVGLGRIQQVYTGTDLNLNQDTTSELSASYELPEINAASISDVTYIILDISKIVGLQHSASTTGYSSVKIEAKEIGGAYSDSLSKYETCSFVFGTGAPRYTSKDLINLKHVHTLTAGQIANGVQFKITTYAKSGYGPGGGASPTYLTIKQILLLAY